jgi:hypothetical protein
MSRHPAVRGHIELECEPLPGMFTGFELFSVLSGDLSKQMERTTIIDAERILIEVFAQKLATKRANGVGSENVTFISPLPNSEKWCRLHEPTVAHSSSTNMSLAWT